MRTLTAYNEDNFRQIEQYNVSVKPLPPVAITND